MSQITISLAQMQIQLGDVSANHETFLAMTAEAVRRQSNLVVFPELWSTGYVLPQANSYANRAGEGTFNLMATTALEGRIAISGSILEAMPNQQVANSAGYYSAEGDLLGIYRKLHLFRLFDEDQYLIEGDAPLSLELPWGTTGMAICYDLRFPELFRHYSIDKHAQMMLICAEWPLIRIAHWRALIIARAIENQCFVVACNATGTTGNTVFGGHSMIVDPWGQVIVEADETPQLITATLNLESLADVRRTIPVFEDLRLDIYGRHERS